MNNTTRVTVDFPHEEHKRLKAVAALMGMSIKDYIILCVEEKIFSKNIPNKKTKKIFEETDQGKNLTACENVDDMLEKLGLNE
jgi:antitoxin component of RelBE/YafQ-DinJ toxin-antitoxin module